MGKVIRKKSIGSGMSRNLFRINNGILTLADGSSEIANFDFEGRLLFFTKSGVLHKRSSDNSLYTLGWKGEVRQVNPVPPEETVKIFERAYEMARNFPDETLNQEEKKVLDRVKGRDPNWLENDSKAILSLYSNLPIMPPDQSSALYLELTNGCRWNRCTICNSYNGMKSEEKTEGEFKSHIQAVKNVMGEGLKAKKGIFIGDAGALDVDQKQLLSALDTLREEFGMPIFSAFDTFSTPKRKNMIHYRDLKSHGLERIFVFIESGSYKVVKLFNDKINVTESLNLVNNIKDHGIAVSIVVMIGMGGRKFSEEHIEGTANIISQMNLEGGDMIFLSPVVESDDPEYVKISSNEGLSDLSPEEKAEQAALMLKAIKESYADMNGQPLQIPIVKYDLREALF